GQQHGFLSINDIRAFENLNPIADGDEHYVQGAMVAVDQLGELVDAQIAAKARPPVPAGAATSNGDGAPPGRAEPRAALPPPGVTPEQFETFATTVRAQLTAATDQWTAATELATWKAFALDQVTGRLVRRELAQLRKCLADGADAPARLEAF